MGDLLRRYWTAALLSRELETDGTPGDARLHWLTRRRHEAENRLRDV
jgi:hypothetical protein